MASGIAGKDQVCWPTPGPAAGLLGRHVTVVTWAGALRPGLGRRTLILPRGAGRGALVTPQRPAPLSAPANRGLTEHKGWLGTE
jgi:hypothetical protein